MYIRKIIHGVGRRNGLFVFFLLLATLLYTGVTGGEEASKEVNKSNNVNSTLNASFVGFGSVDIANLAISLGGNTTYLANSSLIGVCVEQQYRDNALISEVVTTDGGSLRVRNGTGGGYGGADIKVTKTANDLSYTISTSNKYLMEKVLPKIFNLDLGYSSSELTKHFGLDEDSVKDSSLVLSNGGAVTLKNNGCEFACVFPGNQEVLLNSTDFITTDDLISNWGSYKLLNSNSVEHELLYKPELWKMANKLLDNYSIKERKYLITYAPNDTGAKSVNMDNWHINNINQTTVFVGKDNSDKQWAYVVTTVPEVNIYNDKRLYVSNISSESLSQEEQESLSALIYGTQTIIQRDELSELYKVEEDKSVSHVISRAKGAN